MLKSEEIDNLKVGDVIYYVDSSALFYEKLIVKNIKNGVITCESYSLRVQNRFIFKSFSKALEKVIEMYDNKITQLTKDRDFYIAQLEQESFRC